MKNKLLCFILASSMITSLTVPVSQAADADASVLPRIMENLDRGLVAAKVSGGVYLSWRLLGTESLSNQAFDIYKNGEKIYTTGTHDATCYTDKSGKLTDSYKVVRAGTTATDETEVTPTNTNTVYTGTGTLPYTNSVSYIDLKFDAPEGGTVEGSEYTYTANDMSVGDLDGDGQYELVVKWDPSNSKDNSQSGYTGNVIIDAYEMNEFDADGNAKRLWRMDLGRNIRAGAHYTQFLVYDFDCDGKSEIVFKTAPNSKDANGDYVSKVGKGIKVVNDDTADYRNTSGQIITGEEYLTIFNGETGAAMQTVPYEPPRTIVPFNNSAPAGWGDTYGGRSERYLAGVAYLDGVRPSAIFTRGYYTYAYAAAYSWDGKNLNLQWLSKNNPSSCTVEYANGTTKTQTGKTLYGQGAHSVSVADVDNDGCDEVIFGSAVLDHDGTVLIYDNRGHGDAEHVSDFDNDGKQEIFFVHEAGKGKTDTIDYAVDIKRYDASTTSGAYDVMLQPAVGDIARGVMANIDDEFAYEEWQNGNSKNLAAFWSTADGTNLYNELGEVIGKIPNSNDNVFENMFVYWDGDLGRELLDGAMIAKKNLKSDTTTRLFYNGNSQFTGVSVNNSTKANPGLVADIFGDWREEIIYRLSDGTGARIYFSTIPTEYRLTTLMHDSQYRCAIAWQNVGYNQPAHQSYYIGSASLATDSNGNLLNYLEPAVQFTEMTYPGYEEGPAPLPPSKSSSSVIYERGTDTAWSSADLTDWTQTNAELLLDTDSTPNKIYFKRKANQNFSASKIFSLSENATTVKYEVNWHFGSQSSNTRKGTENYEYIQFGSSFRIGWDGSYNTYVSTDGGTSYGTTSIFKGSNSTYNKKIVMEIDAKTGQIISLTFDGTSLDSYVGTTVSDPNQLSFGLQHISEAASWDIPVGVSAVTVTEAVTGAEITGITASTTKTDYNEGEAFDKTTVSVTAHYSDNTDAELTPYYFSVTGYDKTKGGEQTLTVHVGDFTDTITVNVKAKQLTDIILGGSYRTVFNFGEELDTSGLTVTAKYDNGTESEVTDYTVTGYDKTKTGDQIITVSYGGKEKTYTVNVIRYDTYISASRSGATVSAALVNYSDSAQLILAVYDGNNLFSTEIKDAVGTVTFGDVQIPKNGTYKIYAWQSAASVKQICAPYSE